MTTAQQVLERARKFIGTPYKWGGNSPSTGFDCSGFVNYVFSSLGITIGRTTYEQIKQGKKITKKSDLLPGDLVFFLDKNKSPYHVVIYTGNNMMIESPRTGLTVRERNLYRWDGEARRIIDSNGNIPSIGKTPPLKPINPQSETFFRVVCGSFERKSKAIERQESIKKLGFSSFLLTYEKGTTTYFRVICGSFKQKEKAVERQKQLKQKGFDTFLFAYKPNKK